MGNLMPPLKRAEPEARMRCAPVGQGGDWMGGNLRSAESVAYRLNRYTQIIQNTVAEIETSANIRE